MPPKKREEPRYETRIHPVKNHARDIVLRSIHQAATWVPAGCTLNLDATAGSAFTDLSGQGNSPTVYSGTPNWLATGYRGHPGWALTSTILLGPAISGDSDGLTMIIAGTIAAGRGFDGSGYGTGYSGWSTSLGSDHCSVVSGSPLGEHDAVQPTASSPTVLAMVVDPNAGNSAITAYADLVSGPTLSTGATGLRPCGAGYVLGCNGYGYTSDGTLGQILCFNRPLFSAELTPLITKLLSKWS